MLIVENGFDETGSRHRNAGIRVTFSVDNVVSDLNEFLFDCRFVKRSFMMEILIKFFERETRATGR